MQRENHQKVGLLVSRETVLPALHATAVLFRRMPRVRVHSPHEEGHAQETGQEDDLLDYLKSTAYKDQVIISDLPTIFVNDALFCTAIDNLIRNGLKYNDSDTKLVKIYMENDYLVVEDNGRGMDCNEFEYSL